MCIFQKEAFCMIFTTYGVFFGKTYKICCCWLLTLFLGKEARGLAWMSLSIGDYLRKAMATIARSAGVIPEIREAWPIVVGRIVVR